MNFRIICVKGNVYIHADDVNEYIKEYIKELAATEEVDVRTRLLQAAESVDTAADNVKAGRGQ